VGDEFGISKEWLEALARLDMIGGAVKRLLQGNG